MNWASTTNLIWRRKFVDGKFIKESVVETRDGWKSIRFKTSRDLNISSVSLNDDCCWSSSFSWVAVRVSFESSHSFFALTVNSLALTWPPCLLGDFLEWKNLWFYWNDVCYLFLPSQNQFKFLNLFFPTRENIFVPFLKSQRRLSIVPPSCSCKFYEFYREIFSKQSKGLCFR